MSDFLTNLWEAVKAPLRIFVLAIASYLITSLLLWVGKQLGITFTEEVLEGIRVQATIGITALFTALDKYIHNKGKAIQEETGEPSPLVTGLTRF